MVILGRNTMHSKQLKDIDISKNQEYSDRFIDVCNYIRDHCTENLTIDHISAYAGFSKFHFLRLFKKFTGSTCHEYIISNRRIIPINPSRYRQKICCQIIGKVHAPIASIIAINFF